MPFEETGIIYHSSLKLQIELVPITCFWSNVRDCVTRTQWDKIRRSVYQRANNKCEICGEQGTQHPVECHEIWVYDDKKLIQRLDHFQALCPLCHGVKHIGLSEKRGYKEIATAHFIKINEIELEQKQIDSIILAVWKQWALRSEQKWALDIDHLREYGLDPKQLKDSRENTILSQKSYRDNNQSW